LVFYGDRAEVNEPGIPNTELAGETARIRARHYHAAGREQDIKAGRAHRFLDKIITVSRR
jgi:hypothetical protein